MNRSRTRLIKALNRSSAVARSVWKRVNPEKHSAITELGSVRRRLELLITAMYGRSIRIEDAKPVRPPGVVGRLVNRATRGRDPGEIAESDADTIRLPRMLCDSNTRGSAITQYRLLAIEHAERIVRGTEANRPAEGVALERDLYLLAEASAVDSAIAESMRGMSETIRSARTAELGQRPSLKSLNSIEQDVEKLTQRVLSSSPTELPDGFPSRDSTADSLAWARDMARMIHSRGQNVGKRYRGVAPSSLWGTVTNTASTRDVRSAEDRMQDTLSSASMLNSGIEQEGGSGGGSPQSGSEGESDDQDGEGQIDLDASEEAGPAGARLVQSDAAPTGKDSGAPPSNDTVPSSADDEALRRATRRASEPAPASDTSVYPEWDCNTKTYRPHGTTVRTTTKPEGTAHTADEILAEQASIVRTLRQRFERMRAQRVQRTRQRDGDELDLAACVRALVDIRTGHTSDDRLYIDVRSARRAIAITMLVDVSGSTGQLISDERRVIDVERVALLLASEALDALGDRYSILTFSSYGAADVRMTHIKDFGEPNGERVRQRIAAIEPQGKTRLGAAIRHACAQLARQPVSHRLLLIISDGKPNDTDRYFEHYAAEDTRQAILEARATGVYPFCLTVDREEGSEYLAHIFGPAGHTILRQPDQLPFALLKGVQQLLVQ